MIPPCLRTLMIFFRVFVFRTFVDGVLLVLRDRLSMMSCINIFFREI